MPGSYTCKTLVSDFFCHLLQQNLLSLKKKKLALQTFGGIVVAMVDIDLSNFTAVYGG